MLDYEDFLNYCSTNIAKMLGEADYDIFLDRFLAVARERVPGKDSLVHDSVIIRGKGPASGNVYNFDVLPYYKQYEEGMPISDIIMAIDKAIEKQKDTIASVALRRLDILDFDKVKDKLIVMPHNVLHNYELLKKYVYQKQHDVALTLHCMFDKRNEPCLRGFSVLVPQSVFEVWNQPLDVIMEIAFKNTLDVFVPVLISADAMIKSRGINYNRLKPEEKYFMDTSINFSLEGKYAKYPYTLTAENNHNCCVLPFCPGVLDRICELFDDDIYITIPAVYACIVHRSSNISDELALQNLSFNATMHCGEETAIVSMFAYKYTREDRKLTTLAHLLPQATY